MTNAKIKRTLDELQDIITIIKTKADAGASWTNSEERTNIEKRLDHCLDKTNPRHTNLNTDLEIDLKEIEDDKDKEQLEKDKKDLEQTIKEKGELWAKLTPELLTSLASFRKVKKNTDGTDQKDAQGNPVYEEFVDLSELKSILQEIKDKKEKEVDLTGTNTKIEEVKEKLEKTKSPETNYWSIGATISSLVSVALLFFILLKPNPNSAEKAKDAGEL